MENLVMTVWKDRRVLLTGHTGFKGAWAARWLARYGAQVTGLALPPDETHLLHGMLGTAHLAREHLIDLRDQTAVREVVREANPEIVLHLAAQSLVRPSYDDPIETFSTNVMGTAHLLDALRDCPELATVLVITSDKVYQNDETGHTFVESDRLGGRDPYSASKAATEIVVSSYARSFLEPKGIRVATARGGNVIGGGDFSIDRLVPDIVASARAREPVTLRNPAATRPWQHVLDCLSGYLEYAGALYLKRFVPTALNIGPPEGERAVSVGEIATRLQSAFGIPFEAQLEDGVLHEMSHLSINARKATDVLGWVPKLGVDKALDWTVEWYAAYLKGEDMAAMTDAQLRRYEELEV